jgi:hypothetical protein
MQRIKAELSNWLSSKRRIINLLIGLGAVVLYEIARATYRPYIYSQGINDFHIADTIGNSLGTVATIFVFTSLLGRDLVQDYFMIRTVMISVAVYELAHPLLGKSIDPWDLVVTILTGVLCEILYRRINKNKT